MQNKSRELEVAIQAALAAGRILEKYFEGEIVRETKEDKSIVTRADKESEDAIKKIISENFPSHSFLGEETGLTKKASNYTWHVDPLDGTRNFANGIPFFAVSLAMELGGEVIVGVVYNPAMKTIFYAEKGKGAYWNDKKISVSGDDANTCIVTVSVVRNESDRKLGRALAHSLREVVSSTRNFGCTALDLSFVARGNLEATIQLGWYTYDFAAGTLLVEEAGGKITNLEGDPWKFPENYFIASNGVFHDLLVDEVKKQQEKLNL